MQLSVSNVVQWELHFETLVNVYLTVGNASCRDGSVSKICTSGGRQCKTVPIAGVSILVHPSQTWMFVLNESPQYGINVYSCFFFIKFPICFQFLSFPSITCVDQNMVVLLNIITMKVC